MFLVIASLLKDKWLFINFKCFVVQEQIKTQVANMYLWPKTLEVPVIDPSKYDFVLFCTFRKNYTEHVYVYSLLVFFAHKLLLEISEP